MQLYKRIALTNIKNERARPEWDQNERVRDLLVKNEKARELFVKNERIFHDL